MSLVQSTEMSISNGSVGVISLYRQHCCILDRFLPPKILKRRTEDSPLGSQMCVGGYYFWVGFSREVGKEVSGILENIRKMQSMVERERKP